VALISTWLVYSLNWIRQRHEALKTWKGTNGAGWYSPVHDGPIDGNPPLCIRLFGEQGYACVYRGFPPKNTDPDDVLLYVEKLEIKKIESLFPEAIVKWHTDRTLPTQAMPN